ncbi:MAG: hypothetical protein AAB353_09820 [Candidatus Hydrogenedentota bacterium]
MKDESTKKEDDDTIPEYTREQLGKGVRGKYLEQFRAGHNLVLLKPEISRVFPNDAAVNDALGSLIAIARQSVKVSAAKDDSPE